MNEHTFNQLIADIDRALLTAFSVAPVTDEFLKNIKRMLAYTYPLDRLKYLRDQVELASALSKS